MPRRARRRGDQGGTTACGRAGAAHALFDPGAERLLPPAEHGQEGLVRRPEGPEGARAGAEARRAVRCPRGELPARRARSPGPRLRGARGGQPTTRLLLDLGLWAHRPRCGQAGLRHSRGGAERRHEPGRPPRREGAGFCAWLWPTTSRAPMRSGRSARRSSAVRRQGGDGTSTWLSSTAWSPCTTSASSTTRSRADVTSPRAAVTTCARRRLTACSRPATAISPSALIWPTRGKPWLSSWAARPRPRTLASRRARSQCSPGGDPRAHRGLDHGAGVGGGVSPAPRGGGSARGARSDGEPGDRGPAGQGARPPRRARPPAARRDPASRRADSFRRGRPGPRARASLGEHNREIARDLGYADPDIAGLERDGVLHSAPASATER